LLRCPRVSNTEHPGRLVRDKIERIKSVHSPRTTLVLKTLKDKRAPQLKRLGGEGGRDNALALTMG
jgi:DNA-binding Lrp family transcriptional regulator